MLQASGFSSLLTTDPGKQQAGGGAAVLRTGALQ